MLEKSAKKQRRESGVHAHKSEFDAVSLSLARLLKTPLLSLLGGAERGDDASELDRWWTLDGVSNVSAKKLQRISDCFSTLAKLQKDAVD